MTTGFEKLASKDLAKLVRNIKDGIVKVLDMGDEALKPVGKDNPPTATFWLNMGILEMMEAEIWRRGMTPAHPMFGPDLSWLHDLTGAEA